MNDHIPDRTVDERTPGSSTSADPPPAALLAAAAALQHKESHAEVLALCARILTTLPGNLEALQLAGTSMLRLGHMQEAMQVFDRLVECTPAAPRVHYERARALDALGRLDEALAAVTRAIEQAPHMADAYQHQGEMLYALGHADEALASFERALALDPALADAHNNRGVVLDRLGHPADALASFDRALTLAPAHAEALNNRGNALRALGRADEALASYVRATQARPAFTEAYRNRAVMLRELGQLNEALACCEQALAVRADDAMTHELRAHVLREQRRPQEALASAEHAVRLRPNAAEVHNTHGLVLKDLLRLDEARASFDRAINIDATHGASHFNRATVALLQGDWATGWRDYEWRWRVDDLDLVPVASPRPRWLGEPDILDATVLLHAEQGLGDTVQFCRYAARVAERGARVILAVQPPLLRLLQSLDVVDEVIALDGTPLPHHDFHCPLLSLPLALGATRDTIPLAAAYLRPPPERVAYWRTRLGLRTRPRVGLAWRGNPRHRNDRARSMDLGALLARLPRHCEYVSLQPDLRPEDEQALHSTQTLIQVGTALTDFAETAAVCELLDVVISVDTSVAHVAAALGRPTWILLPYVPDWRWELGATRTPWYAAATLYRQDATCSWDGVLACVADDLQRLA